MNIIQIAEHINLLATETVRVPKLHITNSDIKGNFSPPNFQDIHQDFQYQSNCKSVQMEVNYKYFSISKQLAFSIFLYESVV